MADMYSKANSAFTNEGAVFLYTHGTWHFLEKQNINRKRYAIHIEYRSYGFKTHRGEDVEMRETVFTTTKQWKKD